MVEQENLIFTDLLLADLWGTISYKKIKEEIQRGLQSNRKKNYLAKQEAMDEAIKAGADPESLVIVDIEDVPLAYLPGNATRIRVKAAGALAKVEEEHMV